MNNPKREIATLVPWYLNLGILHFFLQKRDAHAPTSARCFGFFGGGIEEGEIPADAIVREIKEELLLDLADHTFFSRYEGSHSINHVFLLRVAPSFAATVTVCEGEYGAFLTLSELIACERDGTFLLCDLLILKELSEYLLKGTAS